MATSLSQISNSSQPDKQLNHLLLKHSTEEILAQSICAALANTKRLRGTVYAVGKPCTSSSNLSCQKICTSKSLRVQDIKTVHSRWGCFGAYHIFHDRPTTAFPINLNVGKLGLKTQQKSCTDHQCDPNYCCCVAY